MPFSSPQIILCKTKHHARLWHNFLGNVEKLFMNKLAVAIVSGIAVGFLAGMLVAPEKGAELRKKISDAAGDLAENLVDIFAKKVQTLTNETQENLSLSEGEILG